MSRRSTHIFPSVSVEYFNLLVSKSERLSDSLISVPDKTHSEASQVFLYDGVQNSILIFNDFVDTHHSEKLSEKWEKAVQNSEVKIEVIAKEDRAHTYQLQFLKDHLAKNFNNSLQFISEKKYNDLRLKMKGQEIFNFTVVDNRMYKLGFDSNRQEGYVCFNGEEEVRRLKRRFYDMKSFSSLTKELV